MKKWAIGIIVFMSVIFLTGIINVKAYNITNIVGYNDINLNNIDSLNGYNQYYTVLKLNNVWCSYNNNCFYESSYPGMIYLQFYNNYDAGFYDYQDSSSQYYNDICGISEYGCFTRITSSFSSSRRLGASYYSLDYGETWTADLPNNYAYTTNPMYNYVIYTTAQLRTRINGTQQSIYDYGYKYIASVNVDSLPNIVYNISVEDNGDMALNYYFNTPNNSGVNLILCIRYTVEGNEGFSCTRDFTNNVIHQFKPIYPNNTYYLSYENLDNGNVIYQIELNVQDYIDSLPEIEKTDIIAEYTYYNQDYLTDSPKALTNLLNVLNAPIQVITDIVLYVWNSLNVYIKLFLIGMFSALMFSAIIRYIK